MSVLALAKEILGADFKAQQNGGFCIISDLPAATLDRAFAHAHYAHGRVRELFPELDFTGPHGVWEMVLTKHDKDLIAYLAAIANNGGMIPGGVFISQPTPHFLMPYDQSGTLDGSLAHELIHGALRNHPTPLWLEEGMAVAVEIHMGQRSHPLENADWLAEIRSHFASRDPATVGDEDAFWDPLKSPYSYDLAYLMVSALLRQRRRFFALLNYPHHNATGEEGLRQIFAMEFKDLARWSIFPRPATSLAGKILNALLGLK